MSRPLVAVTGHSDSAQLVSAGPAPMAEIFISYATEDRERARVLAESLEERGWSTWWDRKIPIGRQFDMVIEEAIGAARCVIVLWSRASVGSEWVRSEATEAKRRGILVPVFLENVQAPLAFRLLNGADLSGWQHGTPHVEFDKLTERVAECLAPAAGEPPGLEASPPRHEREPPAVPRGARPQAPPLEADQPSVARPAPNPQRSRVIAGAVLLLLVAALAVGYEVLRRGEPSPSASDATPASTPSTAATDPPASPPPGKRRPKRRRAPLQRRAPSRRLARPAIRISSTACSAC